MRKKRPVYNYNRKGELIEDLSTVDVPMEMAKRIFEILNPQHDWSETRVIRASDLAKQDKAS